MSADCGTPALDTSWVNALQASLHITALEVGTVVSAEMLLLRLYAAASFGIPAAVCIVTIATNHHDVLVITRSASMPCRAGLLAANAGVLQSFRNAAD